MTNTFIKTPVWEKVFADWEGNLYDSHRVRKEMQNDWFIPNIELWDRKDIKLRWCRRAKKSDIKKKVRKNKNGTFTITVQDWRQEIACKIISDYEDAKVYIDPYWKIFVIPYEVLIERFWHGRYKRNTKETKENAEIFQDCI
jgi:hypothetical protein